jgi:hypothetical protein
VNTTEEEREVPSILRVRGRAVAIAVLIALSTAAWFGLRSTVADAATLSVKPRSIVTTDMEQDDYDSLIRYLMYTNEVDTQGIVYSASRFHWSGDGKGTTYFHAGREYTTPQTSWRWTGNTTIEDQILTAYAASYANLKVHDPNYPTPDYLRSVTKLGNVQFEGDMAADTPGSDLIKARILDDDPRPLWVSVWGGGNTVSRALKSIEDQYKSTPEWAALYKKITAKLVITFNSTGQDDTYANYIRPNWPDVQVYNLGSGAWGYKRTDADVSPQPADLDYFGGAWTKANVLNVGPIGALYYTWADGRAMAGDQLDIFGLVPYPGGFIPKPGRSQYAFISEGDNPAFLNLFDSGLRSWQDPTWGGYGGRAAQNATTPSLWSANTRESDASGAPTASQALTAAAPVGATQVKTAAITGFSAGDPIVVDGEANTITTTATGTLNLAAPLSKAHDVGSTVVGYGRAGFGSNRYVTFEQRDFANRLKWSVTPSYAGANHAPVVSVAGLDRRAAAGDTVTLNNTVTDPDGNAVTTKWWEYKDVDTYPGAVTFTGSSFVVPADAKPGQTIHAVLEATDNGAPALTRYARVVVTVVAKTDATTPAGGTVPATLSLSLGAPAAFGPFTPGLAKDYTAATTATIISTAGDATLSVADPSATATGHLVNGAFSLPQPLQARARNATNTGTAFNNVGSSASPLNLLSYDAPISNDAVALEFKQSIGANDALRTGTYAKTLTFTLSTTTP